LETIGLILLFSLVVLGSGLYLKLAKPRGQKTIATTRKDKPEFAAKFETAVEFFPDFQFPPEPIQEQVPELPWGYDDDTITVMAKDPEWIFAYWDISEEKRENLKNTYGDRWDSSVPVLRVYDVTQLDFFDNSNPLDFQDIIIDDRVGSCHVRVGIPDHTYFADLGRVLSDGTYIRVARSNLFCTPRNNLSDKVDPEWMLVSANERRLLAYMSRLKGVSSAELLNNQLH